MIINGIPIIEPNTITKNSNDEHFYVSYNAYERHYGGATTALVITIGKNERQVFYILEGNHKDQYDKCVDLAECVKYFVSAKDDEFCAKFGDAFEHQHLIK